MAMHNEPGMLPWIIQEFRADPDLVILALLRQRDARPDPGMNKQKRLFFAMAGQTFQKSAVMLWHRCARLGVDLMNARALRDTNPI